LRLTRDGHTGDRLMVSADWARGSARPMRTAAGGPRLMTLADWPRRSVRPMRTAAGGFPIGEDGRKVIAPIEMNFKGVRKGPETRTPHNFEWYFSNHDCSNGAEASAQNKTFTGDIYREHKSFLWGAGNDEREVWLTNCEDGYAPKNELTASEIFDWLIGLNKHFPHSFFVGFSFSYDATMALAGLDYATARDLQKGERRKTGEGEERITDEEFDALNDKEREKYIERCETVFWTAPNGAGYAIAYRKGKMFKVGRLRNPDRPRKIVPIKDPKRIAALKAVGLPPVDRVIDYAPGGKAVMINDVFGFFQSSFVEALDGTKIALSEEENRILQEGKANRRNMAELPIKQVKEYQTVELYALTRMMDKLRSGLDEIGLDVKRWQGAGAIAEAMFARARATDYFPKVYTDHIPVEQEWAHHGFFGGRVELAMQGVHAGALFGYDITSAYPSVMAKLPAQVIPVYGPNDPCAQLKPVSYRKGKWAWRDGLEIDWEAIAAMSPFSMIEIEFNFPELVVDPQGRTRDPPFFPLPYRREDGAILYPARGRGRYFRDEAIEAVNWLDVICAYLTPDQRRGRMRIQGAMEFTPPDPAVKPFAFLENYYERRRTITEAAKDTGIYNIIEKVIKLGINSVYGKTAQKIGGRAGRPPHTANPWVAGAITAGTRAQLLKAALKNPWAVIFFATDGIQSVEPLGVENETKTLGGWEMDKLTAGVWIKPGVYAFVNPPKSIQDDPKYTGKSRGMSVNSILGDVDWRDRGKRYFQHLDALARDLWARGEKVIINAHERFVTFGYATSSEDNWKLAGCWLETTRDIHIDDAGVKRRHCYDPRRACKLIPLKIAENKTPDAISGMYRPEWLGDERDKFERENDADSRDIALARFDETADGED
jgi:hypothetical protein